MKLGGIIANVAVLALVAGIVFHGLAHAQSDAADPEAAAESLPAEADLDEAAVDEAAVDEGVSAESGALAPQLPLIIATDGAITAPSGQVVTFVETIRDAAGPDGLAVRFRFLAPQIAREGGAVSPETAQADMQALCDGYALSRLASTGPQPEQIIISLADRPVPFGEADPDATQFFESFRPENGRCIWEAF